jgi:hypothetical protein
MLGVRYGLLTLKLIGWKRVKLFIVRAPSRGITGSQARATASGEQSRTNTDRGNTTGSIPSTDPVILSAHTGSELS